MNLFDEFERRLNSDLQRVFGMSSSQLSEGRPPLTAGTILASIRELERAAPLPSIHPIIFTPNALERSEERLFSASRHRSARIRKKLIKRFGGEYRYVPVMWKVGNVIYAHPMFRKQIERGAIP